jgi:hypothetical protein
MLTDVAKSNDVVGSTVVSNGGAQDALSAKGCYTVVCRDKDGNFKWEAKSDNLVVNVGLQDMNAKYFTGSAYTAAFYLGLYGAAASNTPAAADTMSSHAGWTEVTAYSQSTRPACTFGTPTTANPSVATNSASAATFSINGTTTVGGAFLTTNNTKGGTTGTLFSAADFQSPGDRSVVNGDTLTVTYTFSLTAT